MIMNKLNKGFAVIDDDDECGTVLIMMGEAKPKEDGMACIPYAAMVVLKDRSRNRSDFPIPIHFPLQPGKSDRIVKHRRCDEIPPDPPWATNYIPGTPEKLEVMAWRYRMGYAVHHPEDVKLNVSRKFTDNPIVGSSADE